MKKLFGGINLTWLKLIIFAIIIGILGGVIALIPQLKETSFQNIVVYFEIWILFGIIIITNSKSALDSALKCIIFFLISQPLIYLTQDFIKYFFAYDSNYYSLFLTYYKNWVLLTILTFPMGFIGYFMKKDKWWGLIILLPMIFFLGTHYNYYLGLTIFQFPYNLLSVIFCISTMIIYPLCIFENKNIKKIGVIISSIIILIATIFTILNPFVYKLDILYNGGSFGTTFDKNYKVFLKDPKFGKIYIRYEKGLEDYVVGAEFRRGGKTEFTLEDPNGNKDIFEIDIKKSTYDVKRK